MKIFFAYLLISVLAILFSVPFIKIYNENQAKKARKERLDYCQRRLHSLTLRFRDECMKETQKVIAKYTTVVRLGSYRIRDWGIDFISDYRTSIEALEKEYIANYAIKYSEGDEWLRIEAEDLPTYITDEHQAEISQIAKTFREISCYMADQIDELKEKP